MNLPPIGVPVTPAAPVSPDINTSAAPVHGEVSLARNVPDDRLQVTVAGTADTTTSFAAGDVAVAGLPPATAAEARKRAEQRVLPILVEQGKYGRVEQASLRPNEYTFYWTENLRPIQTLIKENGALTQTALTGLGEPERKQYQALWRSTKDDIGARLALQLLLIEGTLTAPAPDKGTGTLLSQLHHLADPAFKLVSGIERPGFVCDLMQEVAFPSSISQRHRGTCTMTVVQMFMASQRPVELVRIVGQLAAATDGRATLAGGDAFQREPCTEIEDDSLRTASSRLWQAAAMEYMDETGDYDNDIDRHVRADGSLGSGGGGLNVARTITGLLGPGHSVEHRWASQFESPHVMAGLVAEAVVNGHPTPVALYRPGAAGETGSGHEVLIIGLKDNRLQYLNPWGNVESMSVDDLAAMALEVVFVNADGPQAPVAVLPDVPESRR